MTRIARVPVASHHENLSVQRTKKGGVKLMLGSTHVSLSRKIAVALADALVDSAEPKETE